MITNKTIQTSLNYFRLIFVVFQLMLMAIYSLSFSYMMYLIFLVEIKKSGEAFFFFIPITIFPLITVIVFKVISQRINYVKVNEDGMKVIYPLKFKSSFLEWDKVKGYSRSGYYYGGKLNLKSKSLIIYLKSGEKHEIIKLYNSGFPAFQNQLSKFNIKSLGYEGFRTRTHKVALVKRVYKYDDV